jgi:hypothetical protein
MINKKLVITTQIRENYGTHTWDGLGECPAYWKNKGGNTFVVHNEELMDADSIAEIQTLIEFEDNHFSEETISTVFVDPLDHVAEDYQTIHTIVKHNGKWIVIRTAENVVNGELVGCCREEIKTISRTYEIGVGGEKSNHTVEYELVNGRFAHSEEELTEELNAI